MTLGPKSPAACGTQLTADCELLRIAQLVVVSAVKRRFAPCFSAVSSRLMLGSAAA
jgi:hypothetical protein